MKLFFAGLLLLLAVTGLAVAQSADAPKYSVGDTWVLTDGREISVVRVDATGFAVKGIYSSCPHCLLHYNPNLVPLNATEADGTPVHFAKLPSLLVGPGWRYYDWPLEPGKTWSFSTQGYTRGQLQNVEVASAIKAFEEVKTKAGTFKAYRIQRDWSMNWPGFSGSNWSDVTWWAPEVKWAIKSKSRNTDWELASYSLK